MLQQRREATFEDLDQVPHELTAEIVNGRIKILPSGGFAPARASIYIVSCLGDYEERTHSGWAVHDPVDFEVSLPHRRSFRPDAAFYVGPPTGGRWVQGAPLFAVEVRSQGSYGMRAEREIAAKIADYFAAGTKVVWDVDVLREGYIRSYRADAPNTPDVFKRGDEAHAEPALTGWRVSVDEVMRKAHPHPV